MFRPFRILFALCLVASFAGMTGCSTIYRPMYSNSKNYFKPPDANEINRKGPQLTAEQVLQQTDAQGGGAGAMPPPDANAMLPVAPAPDAGAAPPAAAPPAPQ